MKYYYIVFQEQEDAENSFQWEVMDSLFAFTEDHPAAYIHTIAEITEEDYNKFFMRVAGEIEGEEESDEEEQIGMDESGADYKIPQIEFTLDTRYRTVYANFENGENQELLDCLNEFSDRKYIAEESLASCTSYKIDDIDIYPREDAETDLSKHQTLVALANHKSLPRIFHINRIVFDVERDTQTLEEKTVLYVRGHG
jgi:hypothetical protein